MSEKIYHFIACLFSCLFQLQLLEIECIRKYQKGDKEYEIGEDTKICHLFFTEKLKFKASHEQGEKAVVCGAVRRMGWRGLLACLQSTKRAVVCGAVRRMGWRGLPLLQSRERFSCRAAKRHIQSPLENQKIPFNQSSMF